MKSAAFRHRDCPALLNHSMPSPQPQTHHRFLSAVAGSFRISMICFSLNRFRFTVSSPGILLLENILSKWTVCQEIAHLNKTFARERLRVYSKHIRKRLLLRIFSDEETRVTQAFADL